MNFTVTLSGPAPAGGVAFTATTTDGTATAPEDYLALAEGFLIEEGETQATVSVDIVGDTVPEPDETFTVTIATSAAGVVVGTGTGTGTILNDDALVLEIFEIQGSGLRSPYAPASGNDPGQVVTTQANVVTALASNGFFMQTPDARDDDDPMTSNGIFVFTGASQPAQIGDVVDVTARVQEFFNWTQLTQAAVTVTASGAAMPTAVVLDETRPSPDPANLSCGDTNFECFENMLVHVPAGVVPGGRVEVSAIDPEMGAMFYVYERFTPGRIPVPERSTRCFACHAGTATNYVPGLIAESVLVSMAGSSLQTFRRDEQGHQIPLETRFGGWLLTGKHNLTKHEANVAGQSDAGKITRFDASPGRFSDLSLHLRQTSDILPHLVHEHQLGFENRLFQLSYLLRHYRSEGKGRLTPDAEKEIDAKCAELARYILFADESALPAKGIEGDPDFIRDFQAKKITTGSGHSLKDFDLKTRLFKYRCTYMLYTDSWKEAPRDIKDKVYLHMAQGLKETGTPKDMSHLPVSERLAIRAILKETLPGLPAWWR